jgi:hypothetical protein
MIIGNEDSYWHGNNPPSLSRTGPNSEIRKFQADSRPDYTGRPGRFIYVIAAAGKPGELTKVVNGT